MNTIIKKNVDETACIGKEIVQCLQTQTEQIVATDNCVQDLSDINHTHTTILRKMGSWFWYLYYTAHSTIQTCVEYIYPGSIKINNKHVGSNGDINSIETHNTVENTDSILVAKSINVKKSNFILNKAESETYNLEESIQELHEYGTLISNELDKHNSILETVYNDIEHVNISQKKNICRTRRMV